MAVENDENPQPWWPWTIDTTLTRTLKPLLKLTPVAVVQCMLQQRHGAGCGPCGVFARGMSMTGPAEPVQQSTAERVDKLFAARLPFCRKLPAVQARLRWSMRHAPCPLLVKLHRIPAFLDCICNGSSGLSRRLRLALKPPLRSNPVCIEHSRCPACLRMGSGRAASSVPTILQGPSSVLVI